MKYCSPLGVLLMALVGSACGTYSFTGTAIPEHVETIAIPIFEDGSRSAIPNLSDALTELLIDRFVNQTRLRLSSDEATAHTVLTGRIERYINRPAAVGGDERAAVNRVNLSVTVQYLDRLKGIEMVPRRTFTAFGEYDPLEDGIEGEEEAAVAALEQIADDIFNAATSDW